MPVVHSLLQVKQDLEGLSITLTDTLLWQKPDGAASVGFHLRHIGGSTGRLLTYARGEGLSPEQLDMAKREGTEELSLAHLRAEVYDAIDRALDQIRSTPSTELLANRKVGRAGLPSTTLGLFFHAAEHATRHMGQAITTARILNPSR
jgi:uncharacterized damage-inducible protein DinB